MSVLMPLSWLARVGSLCFNLLLTFPSVVRILSSQVISFQTLCYAPFPRFPWSSLLPFPSYFKLHNLLYFWELISQKMTWPDHQKRLWIIKSWIFTATPTLSQRMSVNTLLTNLTPHIILIIQRSTICNLTSSITVSSYVSQQYSKTGLTQHW